jgi:hypothetical protein
VLYELQTVPDAAVPLAYLCILDNHPTKRYRLEALRAHFARVPHHPLVQIVVHDVQPMNGRPQVSKPENLTG